MIREITPPIQNASGSYSSGYKHGSLACTDGNPFTDEELQTILYGIDALIHDNEGTLKSMKDQCLSKEIEKRNTNLDRLKLKVKTLFFSLNDTGVYDENGNRIRKAK